MLALCGSAAHAQTATPFAERELVNFSYSAIMGTGYYRVADRDIYVFRIPFSLNRHDAQVRDDGTRERGLRWIMPLTLGVYNFSPDLENGLPEPDDIGTVTVLPGIETTWLRPSGWRVRATAQLGAGLDLERDEWTTIVAAGLRSRYELRPMTADQAGISYGQGILWSGFDPDTGERDSLGLIALGMEARWLQTWRALDRATHIGLMIYGNFYFDRARFLAVVDRDETVSREVTIGLSLGGEPAFKILGMSFERFGIGYKTGPGIRAVTLFTSFPF